MEKNTMHQVSENPSYRPSRNLTSSLSASAQPFTLTRTPVPQSKAHSFSFPSSSLELDNLPSGDYITQTFHYQDNTSEGLEECLVDSDYGVINHGTEFPGLNSFGNYSGSLYLGPSDSIGKKEMNTSASRGDRSSAKEGNDACLGHKFPDGSHDSIFRKPNGISERGSQVQSQPKEQMADGNSSILFSSSINTKFSLKVKPKDPEEGAAAVESKEPDEDSPCWRGTTNFPRSPFTTSQFSLNPMAPQYIPQSAERRLNSNSIISPDSDEIWELDEDHFLSDKPVNFALLSPEVVPHILEGEDTTSQETGMTLRVPRNDTKDISVNEALVRFSEYLSKCSSTDAELLINTMFDLSEILVKKHSENHLLREPLDNKIQGIIGNLCMFNGERDPRSSCSPRKMPAANTLKIPSVKAHSSGKQVVIAPPGLGNLSNCRPKKPDSSLSMQNMWDSRTFMGNIGAEIAQANSNALTPDLEMGQQITPQALLYKNLWLQATEELHSLKTRCMRNVKSGEGTSSGRVS